MKRLKGQTNQFVHERTLHKFRANSNKMTSNKEKKIINLFDTENR